MLHPLLTASQSDYSIQIVDINSHTERQTVKIQISWLLKKPTDLDLHCLQKKGTGISRFSRTRVKEYHLKLVCTDNVNVQSDETSLYPFSIIKGEEFAVMRF